jgi:hypothetical protein
VRTSTAQDVERPGGEVRGDPGYRQDYHMHQGAMTTADVTVTSLTTTSYGDVALHGGPAAASSRSW